MRAKLQTRPGIILSVIATALIAAAFAIFALGLLTPPRDVVALQNALTPTVPPSPTSPPPFVPPTPSAVVVDDFSKRDNWPRGGSALPYGYDGNSYVLAPATASGYARVLLENYHDTTAKDLTLEVVAAPASGSAPVEYGILFWHSQPRSITSTVPFDPTLRERFLYASLSTAGTFRVRARLPITPTLASPNNSRWLDIVSSTPSLAINTDGTPNRVRVDLHPNRMLMFINDALVIDRSTVDMDQFQSRADFDGRVGIIALALGKPDASARFSEFKLFADLIP